LFFLFYLILFLFLLDEKWHELHLIARKWRVQGIEDGVIDEVVGAEAEAIVLLIAA
jgi:hypothetical protein